MIVVLIFNSIHFYFNLHTLLTNLETILFRLLALDLAVDPPDINPMSKQSKPSRSLEFLPP